MLHPLIETFMKVAEAGSFSRAAERLYISKVAVMNQINALEKQIGVPLFGRTHQGVVLTEAGKSFHKNARTLMRMAESAIQEAKAIGGARTRTIRVGASMMRPVDRLVALWEAVRGDGTEFRFDIVPFSDGADGLHTMLQSLGKTIDCFVTPCASTRILMDYGFWPFSSCKCAVAMSRKHRLAKKERLRWEELENESLLLVKRGDSYVLDEMRDDIFRDHPSIRVVDFDGYYDISAFNLCERQGYLMETLDVWKGLHPSLVTVPVEWKYEIPYGIVYEKNPSETMRKFMEILRKR